MMICVLKKIFWRWCHFARFLHVGVRGVWLNVQRKFRPGKKILLRCFQNR